MNKRLSFLLLIVGSAAFTVAPWLIFRVVKTPPLMNFAQRIFYFHVPCAWSMMLTATISAVGGGIFLFANRRRGIHSAGARLCRCAAELTFLYGLLVLITGPLWARKAWGHYWVWDARLTTMLVLFLAFTAVLLAARFAGPRGLSIASGLAMFGAANIPLVYISVHAWNTIHPKTSVVQSLPGPMLAALLISLFGFTQLTVALLMLRLSIETLRDRVEQAYCRIAELE